MRPVLKIRTGTERTPSASHFIKEKKKDGPSGLPLRVGKGASKEPKT